MPARGWTCYTSRGQTAGEHLADCLYRAAALWLPGHKLRKDYSDGDPDWESDFFILKNPLCGAALTENLFHDNSDDCLFLESEEGRRAIVSLHVEGLVNYVLKRCSLIVMPDLIGHPPVILSLSKDLHHSLTSISSIN